MNSIFMVHSVISVSTVGKVTRDLNRDENSHGKRENADSEKPFAQILETEVGNRRKESFSCHNVTYGMDRRLHSFDYRAREYHY